MNTVPSPAPSDAPSRSRWRWRRPGKRGQRWLAILVFLFAALLILIALWDWNWFKGPVERAVQAKTGREFHITGDLDVDLGRVTTVRGDGLTFANVEHRTQERNAAHRNYALRRASMDSSRSGWPRFSPPNPSGAISFIG